MSSPTESNGLSELFTGDRYERLSQGADVLAEDPAVIDAPFPFNSDGLRTLVTAIASRRLLDHLSDSHADVVTALLLMDFHCGPTEVGLRIQQLLDGVTDGPPAGCETLAVISGLAAVLALMVDTTAWCPVPTGSGRKVNEPGLHTP